MAGTCRGNHHTGGEESGLRTYCSHHAVHDPGPIIDWERWQRAEQLDFSIDGPAPLVCQLCGKLYKDWKVGAEQFSLLPKSYQHLSLCEEDFLRLLKEAGQDPSAIQISYDPWESKVSLWKEDQDSPRFHTNIRFEFGWNLPPEIM